MTMPQAFRQLQHLQEYCKRAGRDYLVYQDIGFSGRDPNRPALTKMMADIKLEKLDNVIVTDSSRLARSFVDLIEQLNLFTAHNILLIMIGTNGGGLVKIPSPESESTKTFQLRRYFK